MWNQLNEQLMKAVSKSASVKKKAELMNQDLVLGFVSPRSAAKHILELFLSAQQVPPQNSPKHPRDTGTA